MSVTIRPAPDRSRPMGVRTSASPAPASAPRAPASAPPAPASAPRAWASAPVPHVYAPIPMDKLSYLVSTAARAPSVHNTQPWRFCLDGNALELHVDRGRALRRTDPAGREMLMSCGAALFGLRLAVRGLGYLPAVELFPSPAQPDLLARVRLGTRAPITPGEHALLVAIHHRYTQRGPFTAERTPPGLLAGLQHDAAAEHAALVRIARPSSFQRLAELVAVADRRQREHAVVRAEVRRWTRPAGSRARDGVPARAYPLRPARAPGSLPLRDFDLGRGWGRLDTGGTPPTMTAVLITAADDPADWLRAGQALHRLLVHAAVTWVFASLHSQPLESAQLRAEVRARLKLPGAPQMLLQLGRAHVVRATARRPVGEMLTNP